MEVDCLACLGHPCLNDLTPNGVHSVTTTIEAVTHLVVMSAAHKLYRFCDFDNRLMHWLGAVQVSSTSCEATDHKGRDLLLMARAYGN